jgi:hypothetical protein
MEINGQLPVQVALPRGTHWIGGWVGPTTGRDKGERNANLSGGILRFLEARRDNE